jgi:hypothetical protein
VTLSTFSGTTDEFEQTAKLRFDGLGRMTYSFLRTNPGTENPEVLVSHTLSGKEAPSSPDQRVATRFPCSQVAFCWKQKPRDYIFWAARAQNISTGGIRLVVGHQFNPGTILSMELMCADQRATWELPARVIYVAPGGAGDWSVIGCQFVNRLSETELVAML